MSRRVEQFSPLDPSCVSMYVCGPTVYDEPHIGNLRPAIVFDILVRLLKYQYPNVVFARNFTDIDDKIIDRARNNNETIYDLTEKNIKNYRDLMSRLAIDIPSVEPRATEYIEHMIRSISKLIDSGYAYVSQDHVLFDIAAYQKHGSLSKHNQNDLESGLHRIAVEAYKKAAGDFVLWKPSDIIQPGWASPWGRGRPGWHIECSSMIESIFENKTIDIHGGGADLRFPHHECEISQFESVNNKPLANYWVHNGMLTVNGKKMAKSVGNVLNVSDLLSKHHPFDIRLAMVMTHYRSNLDWTDSLISQARNTMRSWNLALENIESSPNGLYNSYCDPFFVALNDDMNTPEAIQQLHHLFSKLNSDPYNVASAIRFCGHFIGLSLDATSNDEYLRGGIDKKEIEALLHARNIARQEKNYKVSDSIRDLINSYNITVEDQANGKIIWYK